MSDSLYDNNLRFQPSGLNSHFEPTSISFTTYINKMRDIISLSRLDLTPDTREKIIHANTPFEIKPKHPNGSGVLLIAGLYDCPYTMRNLGEHFARQNYWVRCILNPGHGTVPGDLLEVSHTDWQYAAHYGLQSFYDKVEKVIVAGFSTGAALALALKLTPTKYAPPISAMILLAPCFGIHNKMARYAGTLKKAGALIGQGQWFCQLKDDDYTRYLSISINSIEQIYNLAAANKQLWLKHRIDCPIFIAHTDDDIVVDTQDTLDFFKRQPSPRNKLLYISRMPHNFSDPRISTLDSNWPNATLLPGLAHKALPFPETCPHYGPNGDYYAFSTIAQAIDKLMPKSQQQEPNFISRLRIELKSQTFNPAYAEMLAAIDNFLQK